MNVAFRLDVSAVIGTGHLMRCISLAQSLQDVGARCHFVLRQLGLDMTGRIQASGFEVHELPPPDRVPTLNSHADWAGVDEIRDAAETAAVLASIQLDWIVVDHYSFSADWHSRVREATGARIVAIDDLGDRPMAVDVLVDHNYHPDHQAKYHGRLEVGATLLTGPTYALLSPSYADAPRYAFHAEVRSLGIFVGGTDPSGASAQVLKICRRSGFAGPIEIVSTSVNPNLSELRATCALTPDTFLTLDEPDLAHFFARHDLQIGAGGGATWERCCIGVPTIGLVLAANHMAVVPELDKLGVLRAARLDSYGEPADLPELAQVLAALLADADARRSLGERATLMVDGRGSQRVALSLSRDTLRLRPATIEDGPMLHRWRNHPAVRAVSRTRDPIPLGDHLDWLQRVLVADDRRLFVAEVGRLPVGCIRFDLLAVDRVEASLYLDPALQGLGLGRRLLLGGERAMREHLGRDFTVDASVLAENTASRHLFEVCGYHGGPLQYQKTIGATPTFR